MVLPIVLGFVLLVMTWVSAFACNLFEADRAANMTMSYGPWLVQGITFTDDFFSGTPTFGLESFCFSYNAVGFLGVNLNSYIDTSMQVARAFSMMGVILSVITYLLILFPGCCVAGNPKLLFMTVGGMAVFTGICQLLTLVR